MLLRRLNDEGIRRMGGFLDSLTTDRPERYPEDVLTDRATSEPLAVSVEVARCIFPRRFEMAEYLWERLSGSGLHEPERDAGLWAWLALYWFELLCPPDRDGRRKPGERLRWIPNIDDWTRTLRHLALGPYAVYAAYAHRTHLVEPLLCDPLPVPTSEIFRLFAENRRLLMCPGVLDVARRLYYDDAAKRLIRGAATKDTGGIRRLVAVLSQLDRTYDLPTLTSADLLRLLPAEFVGDDGALYVRTPYQAMKIRSR